jgi:ribosomal protein S18 acetylase RimI-like enzyme
MFPHLKKDNIKSIILDIKLIFNCTGIGKIKQVLNREKQIKATHPIDKMYYLWFIGVSASDQGKGIGSLLLQQVLQRAALKNLSVFLETSTLKNIPWYKKMGFNEYSSVDLGYQLHFLSNQ